MACYASHPFLVLLIRLTIRFQYLLSRVTSFPVPLATLLIGFRVCRGSFVICTACRAEGDPTDLLLITLVMFHHSIGLAGHLFLVENYEEEGQVFVKLVILCLRSLSSCYLVTGATASANQ